MSTYVTIKDRFGFKKGEVIGKFDNQCLYLETDQVLFERALKRFALLPDDYVVKNIEEPGEHISIGELRKTLRQVSYTLPAISAVDKINKAVKNAAQNGLIELLRDQKKLSNARIDRRDIGRTSHIDGYEICFDVSHIDNNGETVKIYALVVSIFDNEWKAYEIYLRCKEGHEVWRKPIKERCWSMIDQVSC